MDGDRVFGSDIHITFIRADGITGDGHGFDHGVRVTFQNGTVHESTRVAFVGVADHILLIGDAVGGKLPFTAGGESAAASAAQTGGENGIDHLLGRHFRQDFTECGITVYADVFIDLLGIDDTAVTERNALLLFVELGVGERVDIMMIVTLFSVHKTMHHAAFEQMLRHDLLDIFHFDIGVEGAFGIDDHNGAEGAKTEATGLHHLHFFIKTGSLDLFYHQVVDFLTVRRSTPGTSADQYMRTNHFITSANQASSEAAMVYSVTTSPPLICLFTTSIAFSGVIFT